MDQGTSRLTSTRHPPPNAVDKPMPSFLSVSASTLQDIVAGEQHQQHYNSTTSNLGIYAPQQQQQRSGSGNGLGGGNNCCCSSTSLVKGPLYMRYDDKWILCTVEVSSSKLRINVHPEVQKTWSLRIAENKPLDMGNASSSLLNLSLGGDADSLLWQRSLNTSKTPTSQQLSPGANSPQLLGGGGGGVVGGSGFIRSPRSDVGSHSSSSRPSLNPLILQHPLNRNIDVEYLREAKILQFLHYFDNFTFEIVCKRSSKPRSKFSHLSMPSHFTTSVNDKVGLCRTTGDRYEVLTFKAVDQTSLFQWIDAFEDAADPIEELVVRNLVQPLPTADWPIELPVFGQVKAHFGGEISPAVGRTQLHHPGGILVDSTTSICPSPSRLSKSIITTAASSANTQGLSNIGSGSVPYTYQD